MEQKSFKPWYKKWWGILLTFMFFPILVPYLVWTKTSWNKVAKIGITIVCLFIIFASITGNEQAQKEALELTNQAEAYISEGKIDEALEAISKSKELFSDKEKNNAYTLEEIINLINSEEFMKKTLLEMSDSDFEILKKGELTTSFVDHPGLNTIFLEKLTENANKRAEYIAEIEKQKREEEKRKRKEMIEKQFSAWDGSHRNLTKFIKEQMNDPDSYEHVETIYWDMKDHLVVMTTFRGKNAFGGVVKNAVKAKVSLDGEILEIMDVIQ